MTTQKIRVSGLFLYPVKGARGIPLDQAELSDRGLLHDRRFMVVDATGEFLTQRSHPALALIEVQIRGAELVITAPGAGELSVPLRPGAGETRRVRVWGHACDAIALGEPSRRFFERALGTPSELVYMPDETIRPADPAFAPDGARVSFADDFPFMLLSQASLDDLNTRLEAKVPMNRFRPNIVVEGCGPYAEDTFGTFTIGAVAFQAVKLCGRCKVITIDQATGVGGKEPLATLARFRTQGNQVNFGQFLIPRGQGVIRTGDLLELVG